MKQYFSPKKLIIALFPFSICLSAPIYSANLDENIKIAGNDPVYSKGTIAIGNDVNNRRLNGKDSITIGTDSQIGYGSNTIALGTNSYVVGNNTIAIGNNALNKGSSAISFGDNAKVSGGSGIAIGKNASQGKWREKFPTESTVSVTGGIAIGDSSQTTDVASVALGNDAKANNAYTTAIGDKAIAQGKSSTALGSGANSQSWGSVALGLGSVANREKGDVGYLSAEKTVGNESSVTAKMSTQSQERLKDINSKINEYSKVVDPIANAYYSLRHEYDKKLQEVHDSDLQGQEYSKKINELRAQYQSEVVKRSAALNNTPEYAELQKFQAEKAGLLSTYISTKGAVSIGNDAVINENGEVIQHANTRQLTNLAAGSKDTDAVNVAQLKDLQSVMEGADNSLSQRITDIKTLTDEHSTLIENNKNSIIKNTNDISNLKNADLVLNDKINNNKKNIDKNSTLIENNKNSIIKNTNDISDLKNSNLVLNDKINDNKKNIDENSTAIKNNTNSIVKNEQNITNNTNNINRISNEIINNTQRFNQLESKIISNEHYIRDVEKEMHRGLASQAALNGLFQPYGVGKFNLTAAVGGYNSETAIAVGSGYRINEDIAIKAGIATNTGNFEGITYNAGVNFEW
ncbi:TPA: YadA-like family protein [Proteus mirabilis]|uniref:YadA-like family protein n=2 Tax=Proteus mirabilis TaxID=584 RepID=UPI001A1F72C3|nr:YadA-like family protein [Proteus mirabilis]EKU9860367.1 YadA-like family protein [Proteus mirabilis]MBI6246731.1 YadA-like family protein [Proteus mirabilis]MDF7207201.1 YadA-like family protein [Proteus mirabilis]MDF7416177.1 YadA-like family protein [Proteus mirabilis]HBC6577360.1 YadA-like family protein [Proteus mirabilis]